MNWLKRHERGLKTYLLFEANGLVYAYIFKAQLFALKAWELKRIRGG